MPLSVRFMLALCLALLLGGVALPHPVAARQIAPAARAGTGAATTLRAGTPTPAPQPGPTPTPSPHPVGGGQGTGGEGSCPVGQWGFAFWPSPICIDIQGFVSAVAAAITQPFRALADAMLTGVDALLTGTPNFATEGGWADLQGFFDYLNTLAKGLFVAFFLIAAFRYLLTSLGGDSAYEAIGALRRGFVGLLVLQLATGWPAWARRSAMARPKPREAPVTIEVVALRRILPCFSKARAIPSITCSCASSSSPR